MATATLSDCSQLEMLTLERVKYFPRQLLTADDMTADQDYFRAKQRRHNRYLHGWGVVCGLQVTVAPGPNKPWQVQIGSGYALGPFGDEIYVPTPILLDLAQCGPGASTDPCDPGTLLQSGTSRSNGSIFIAIRYEECYSRPVRVMPGGCGCQDIACETSRINDSFEIDCIAELPPSHQPGPAGPSICDLISGQALAQCPPCPTDPWVVLAQATLPPLGTPLAQTQVNNFVRRQIFSTAAIQEQVILCCCTGSGRRPARVTSINPASGTVFTNASTVPPAVILTFSKNLQPATVNTNTIQVVRVVPGANSVLLQGVVTYDDGNRSAQFAPAQAFTIPAVYQVTVVGSGPSAILDSDNLSLDGNDDGQPGGNFISQFTVQTTTPTPTPTPTTAPTPTPTPTPTLPSGPLTGLVQAQSPPPSVNPVPNVLVSDLSIRISGGTTGTKITGNLVVTLSANLASTPAADTAQLSDSSGNVVAGVKSQNAYTFPISVVEPGVGGQFVMKIANMKANATGLGGAAGGGNVINAFISISSTPPIPLTNPVQIVATVTAG